MVCRVPLWCWIFGGQLLSGVISCPCQLATSSGTDWQELSKAWERGISLEGLDIKRIPLMPKKWYHV